MPPWLNVATLLVVVAHPDDEIIGAGALLGRLSRRGAALHLAVATDGAHAADASRLRFPTLEEYGDRRHAELEAALECGGITIVSHVALDLADQHAHEHLAAMARVLKELVTVVRPDAVLTHAYEGGHPDHDSVAWAVHRALGMSVTGGPRPVLIEMPLYHAASVVLTTGRLLDEETDAGWLLELSAAEKRTKRAMFGCYARQREVLGLFDCRGERFRRAPAYNFEQPPHHGSLWYEARGWSITGPEWRRAAAQAASIAPVPDPPCGGLATTGARERAS